MMLGILEWVGSFLRGPLLKGALDAYKAKLANDSNSDARTVDLAGRELAVEQRELELQGQLRTAEIGRWYEPEKLFAYVLVLYIGKVCLWDAAMHLGVTDHLTGDVATWASWIMSFYVGRRGVENVARILKRK